MTVESGITEQSPEFTAASWADALADVETGEFAARVAKHLREEQVVWLTTVSLTGLPSPNPIWFLWDGASTVRIYTTPDAIRLRNLQQNPKVSLNFAANGFDIVVVTGTAEIDTQAPASDTVPEFVEKYTPWYSRVNQTRASYAKQYPVLLTISLDRVRGI